MSAAWLAAAVFVAVDNAGAPERAAQNGLYFLMRKVASLDAIVGFGLEEGRLVFVDVQFPMPDEPVI